jgi:uncharacterized protein (DUF433 family)
MTKAMDLTQYLERDPETLAGMTRVRGTRLSIDYILSLLEAGWTESRMLKEFPQLTEEALRAVFSFARRSLDAERIIPLASQSRHFRRLQT